MSIYKKILRLNPKEVILATALLLGATTEGCIVKEEPKTRGNPEIVELIGFDEYLNRGYSLKEFKINTKGEVILIRNIAGLAETTRTDSTITLEGLTEYKIKPNMKYSPNRDGNIDTSKQIDYWKDIRKAKLTFVRR